MKIEIPNADVRYHAAFFKNADEVFQRLNITTNWQHQNVVLNRA